jgi:acyl-CoA thioesterase FadM
MGFTRAFSEAAQIGRMLVEMRHVPLGPAAPGKFLRADSHFLGRSGKSFLTAHVLRDHEGQAVARFDLCSLAVDLTTRRATALPDFLP